MRVLTTAAAAALTLGLFGLSAPAFADSNSTYGNRNGGAYGQGQQSQPYQGGPGYQGAPAYDDDGYDGQQGRGWGNESGDDDRGYDRYERGSQDWERGWDKGHGERRWQQGHGGMLPKWVLVKRIERQGYYNVRRLQPGRWGFGWRAFARSRLDGHRMMLRIDPFTGRILSARHLWS